MNTLAVTLTDILFSFLTLSPYSHLAFVLSGNGYDRSEITVK